MKKTKASFKRDEKDRVVLGSAKEMAEWVKLGFEEQNKTKDPNDPLWRNFIDLRNCVLYISYPSGSKEAIYRIFNLCDMAGIVTGIEKTDGDPNYLYEVKLDILLDGSFLYGNYFHYVKFDGRVSLDNVIVQSTFSCFKCLFMDSVYMQHIHITGRSDFEQCDFKKGLVLTGGKADLFHFNNCSINERLWLSSVSLVNQNHESYHQSIELTNSVIENLKFSKVNTNGLPIYVGDSIINGLHIDNVSLECSLYFGSCSLEGVITAVTDKEGLRNKIKELVFHSCELDAQYHIENTDIEKFKFNFCKIGDKGRLRLFKCGIKELTAGCSSVFGQMDVLENEIKTICLEGTCVQGYLNFQENKVEKYTDRQTLRMLKNEALKVNDHVEATKLYAKEMNMLLADETVSPWDKWSLRLNKWFSSFGESWVRAFFVTVILSVILTFLLLGFGSAKYMFNPNGEFVGVGSFFASLLDITNVFSIPLFSDTIKEYELNIYGQILYFVIKLVVVYGSYQFVVAFRKYGRRR